MVGVSSTKGRFPDIRCGQHECPVWNSAADALKSGLRSSSVLDRGRSAIMPCFLFAYALCYLKFGGFIWNVV
ncbi:hypothetical protein shim_02500 [Shimia sp. SK013]|nr:hypothetical protein shim_02500 [Shimia sp. SK013]